MSTTFYVPFAPNLTVSYTIPVDWNNSNNSIHLIGAGGAGFGCCFCSGGGGGGGGYTKVTNFSSTPGSIISFVLGTSGATTFNGGAYSAGAGNAGSYSYCGIAYGGTGSTYDGGSGGPGGYPQYGGGGGGAAGPLGNGGNGSYGGGGNGGGSSSPGTSGGNNAAGTGGGGYRGRGTAGGGGGANQATAPAGSIGQDIGVTATFTASATNQGILTVSAISSGKIVPGMAFAIPNRNNGIIAQYRTGGGGIGTYFVNGGGCFASTTIVGSYGSGGAAGGTGSYSPTSIIGYYGAGGSGSKSFPSGGYGGYGLLVVEYTTSTTNSLLLSDGTAWTVPADWSSTNKIVLIGAGGGSSGVINGTPKRSGSGGGGGGSVVITNLSLTPGATINYTIGVGGDRGLGNATTSSGTAGGNTTFNSGAYTAGGGGGGTITTVGGSGGAGGTGTYAGGAGGVGGTASAPNNGCGPFRSGGTGGGAAGYYGIGGAGLANTTYVSGGASVGGSGDDGKTPAFSVASGMPINGAMGTEIFAGYGSGSGGSTNRANAYSAGRDGGMFGGGAAGPNTNNSGSAYNGGTGASGAIFINYTPLAMNPSGPISLGGTGTENCSVNLRLGLSATAQISMNCASVRTLTGTTAGAVIIMPTNFYGQ